MVETGAPNVLYSHGAAIKGAQPGAGENMILRQEPFFTKHSPLEAYARNVTSQYGEDGIIAHVMKALKPTAPYCVEFGAWDGKLYSNCFNLLKGNGWSGLLIEASADKFVELQATYADTPRVTLANRLVDIDGPNRLDALLREASAPQSFALLSIDIDGNDYYVWESLTDFTPELVVIEFNPSVPNDVVFVQDKSFDINQGCSLLALVQLGKRKGYKLAVCTACNAFLSGRTNSRCSALPTTPSTLFTRRRWMAASFRASTAPFMWSAWIA